MNKKFGAEEWMYGLTISAMSISNLIVGPVMGAIYDRTHWTKALVLFLNMFEIGGNFMYFAATSKYMVIGGRFLIGIGVGAGAVLYGEIAYTYSTKQRTTAFSVFMAARQIGLVFGPGLNLFLRICQFNIGPFTVNKWTSPALFMMIIWIIIQLMFLFFFYQQSPVQSTDRSPTPITPNKTLPIAAEEGVIDVTGATDQSGPLQASTHSMFRSHDEGHTIDQEKLNTINEEPISLEDHDNDSLLDEEHNDLLGNQPQNYGSISSPTPREDVSSPTRNGKGRCQMIGRIAGQFVTEQIMLLLGFLFITQFNQMILETGVVPLTQNFFNWTEFELSLYYSGVGTTLVSSFILVIICTKIFSLADRWLICFGLVGVIVSCIWNVALLSSGVLYSWSLAVFLVGTVLSVVAVPFVFVPSASLYSKFVHKDIQGFGQGVRRSVSSVANIMGPLWAGATFSLVDITHYYTFFGVPLLLNLIIVVLFSCSFTKLKEVNKKTKVSNEAASHKD
jgi:ceroid-lipofuscinosis MFS transporter 7